MSRRGLVLAEYESIEVDLTRSQAEAIQRTGFIDVGPAAHGRWRLSATSWVGTMVVSDVELLVRPKIKPDNLFLLLEPGLPHSAWRSEAFDYASSSDLLPSVVALFARTVETTLGRGVLRAYRDRREPLIAMRGRIDLERQFKQPGVITPIACSYGDFTEDIVENRVLRFAIRLALRVRRVDPADRQRLMRQLVKLEGVADALMTLSDVDGITFTRLNIHYASAIGLARLLMANLTLTDARGTTAAATFMVDMNDLFQRFISGRLRAALQGILVVEDEPTVHLGNGRQVSMLPDLRFCTPSGIPLYVADIKYKVTDDARARSADYYQLLAYTTALDLEEGMLIYNRASGGRSERSVTVRNAGKRLTLRAIDLSGPTAQVESETAQLADAVRHRALEARARSHVEAIP